MAPSLVNNITIHITCVARKGGLCGPLRNRAARALRVAEIDYMPYAAWVR
jgi:hypothetical protein